MMRTVSESNGFPVSTRDLELKQLNCELLQLQHFVVYWYIYIYVCISSVYTPRWHSSPLSLQSASSPASTCTSWQLATTRLRTWKCCDIVTELGCVRTSNGTFELTTCASKPSRIRVSLFWEYIIVSIVPFVSRVVKLVLSIHNIIHCRFSLIFFHPGHCCSTSCTSGGMSPIWFTTQ